jgi:hypothetical protein
VEDFYEAFFVAIDQWEDSAHIRQKMSTFEPREYLKAFPFYTDADRQFRFVRDELLGPERYNRLMDRLMAQQGITPSSLGKKLWMTDREIAELHSCGHVIGLHSHTHPTRIERLTIDAQRAEYLDNFNYLHLLLGTAPESMSHPCNSYTRQTLSVLRDLGIKLGFRANMSMPGRSELEYAREDPANLVTALAA